MRRIIADFPFCMIGPSSSLSFFAARMLRTSIVFDVQYLESPTLPPYEGPARAREYLEFMA